MNFKILQNLVIYVLTVFFYFALVTSLSANSSSYYDKDGVTIFPVENKHIVLKKEIIKIEHFSGGTGKWAASCEFIFYNKDSEEELVTMGYPDWVNGRFDITENYIDKKTAKAFWKVFDTLPKNRKDVLAELFRFGYGYSEVYAIGYKKGILPYIPKAWNLHDLNVKISGKNIDTQHRPIGTDININKRYPEKFSMGSMPPAGAYIWKVRFKPHETKVVKVTFSFSGLTDIGYQEVSYILKTGALWADRIGEADIFWDIGRRKIEQEDIFPSGYKLDNNVIHWHFENFDPDYDISIFMPVE